MKKIRVMVVDDSALIRQLLSAIFNAQPDMEVVFAASSAVMARDAIRTHTPDVLTLDVEMPNMNGIEFLQRLMAVHPLPVVMVSTLTDKGSEMTLRALELGAIDFVCKPKSSIAQGLHEYSEEICGKVRAAAGVRMRARTASNRPPSVAPPQTPALCRPVSGRVILLGSSTGGTEAVREFLMRMPPDCPGILIAQHMPENFTRSFAERLNNTTGLTVCEAEDGQPIQPGHAFVAPGHSHLLVERQGGGYVTRLSKADPVNRHRPSVDVLFYAGAKAAGSNVIGVILTGMGRDGAAGMLAMHQAGATNFAQDEDSCVVFGMPREAIAMGGVDKVVPLKEMARWVCEAATARMSRMSRNPEHRLQSAGA